MVFYLLLQAVRTVQFLHAEQMHYPFLQAVLVMLYYLMQAVPMVLYPLLQAVLMMP